MNSAALLTTRFRNRIETLLLLIFILPSHGMADWPQAAGPHHNYQIDGNSVTRFSVTRNHRVLWKTPLPNTGESTPIVVNGRVFLTCHEPMKADAESGRDILGMCFDASTGKELWRRSLPASRTTDMASGFSDNTAASPVSDGRLVCFINVGGSVRTYDLDGKLMWQQDWIPFGRHHARQQEPILYDGNVIFLRTVADNLTLEATTKAGAKPLGRGRPYWTHLHAFELSTGKLQWIANAGTSVHSASMLNLTEDGTPAILTGRGGGHQPPEEPYGLSLISAETGQTIRDLPIMGYQAHQNAVWRGSLAVAIVGTSHHSIDMKQGTIGPGLSLFENVRLRRRENDHFLTEPRASLPLPRNRKALTYQTNCLVGDYHYFRSHKGFRITRVHVPSGQVESLQVPVQIDRSTDSERMLWDESIENDVRNRDGFVVCQDLRARLSGWGHVSAASPIVVGDAMYFPTMTGTVYTIRWNAAELDESALLSVSDLGPAGKTWTLSSLSCSENRLYARTIKELICLGK